MVVHGVSEPRYVIIDYGRNLLSTMLDTAFAIPNTQNRESRHVIVVVLKLVEDLPFSASPRQCFQSSAVSENRPSLY
jgi:hypothetical protein